MTTARGRRNGLLPAVIQRSLTGHPTTRHLTRAEARAVLDAMLTYPWPPHQITVAARNRAVMVLAAKANLHGHWLAKLTWEDIRREAPVGVLLRSGGLRVLVLADDEVLQTVDTWRVAVTAVLGREPSGAEPLFPQLGHWPRAGKPPARLRPMVSNHFVKLVRGALAQLGVPPQARSLYALRGSLVE